MGTTILYYSKALQELKCAIELSKSRTPSKLEKQGLIQCFEYTHELAWKTLKDFLENRGVMEIFGSRDTVREAFKLGLIVEGEIWMEMSKKRNLTSPIYDEVVVKDIATLIIESYFKQFQVLSNTLSQLQNKHCNL